MRHVVAQMSVAVTSRALLMALDARGVDPDTAYVIALWLPVLGSAAVVEVMSLRALGAWLSWFTVQERMRRVAISPFASMRPRGIVSSVARLGR
jgi:hypothetical protein